MMRRWLTTWRVLLLVIPLFLCACTLVFTSDLVRVRSLPVYSTPQEITVNGRQRQYRIYVPESLTPDSPSPLLFMLHGGGGDAISAEQLTLSKFHTLADEQGFIVVYPEGVGKHWNDGRDLNDVASKENVDDVGYIAALIDHLDDIYTIDRERVYAAGMSNGAMMAYRLACDLSTEISGIAAVSNNLSLYLESHCEPQRPIPVLIIMGVDDPQVPFEGGNIRVFGIKRGPVLSTAETLTFWQQKNGCTDKPAVEALPDPDSQDHTSVRHMVASGCAEGSAAEAYLIEGGGHTWPGGAQYLHWRLVGYTSRDFDASTAIWDFFDAQAARR